MAYCIFRGLSHEEAETLKKLLPPPEKFKKGNELYRNGYVAVLVQGSATVKRIAEGGQAITVRSLKSGELFGAASVFGEWKSGLSSIVADTACAVIYLGEQQLRDLFLRFPPLALNYITFLSDKIRFLNLRLDTFTAASTQHRLYEFLISQADDDGVVTVDCGMTKLAKMLNVGRTSLYRDIESLQKSGLLIRENKKFIIKR